MAFTLGEYYARKAIHEAIGGGEEQAVLAQKNGKVLVAFYDSVINPRGPQRIQVGKGGVMIAKARLLATQEEPIPVFRKADVKGSNAGKYEYVGRYVCTGISENAEPAPAPDPEAEPVEPVAIVITMQYVSA